MNTTSKRVEERCECRSSNRPDIGGSIPARVVDPNEYFNWDAKAKKVAIDECIADEVIALWSNGIWTRGSCCGHNDFWERGIILSEEVSGVLLTKAHRLVGENTKLNQWRLVDLTQLEQEKLQAVDEEKKRIESWVRDNEMYISTDEVDFIVVKSHDLLEVLTPKDKNNSV